MFPPSKPSAPQTPKPKKPPEEKSGWGQYLGWVFIILALVGMGWMFKGHYTQPKLTCQNTVRGANSLTAMGTCTEE